MSARQHDPSRLEGFSDAVFGFALTLLVVQLEAPKDSAALALLVRGSIPFALTFAMVCYLWWEHNKFFRRYGLQDAWTAFLNSALLFVVLFYVYPLKFLTTALLGPALGLPATDALNDGRFVMVVYSVGVTLIFGLFALLYGHAWRRRVELELDASAQTALRFGQRAHLLSAGLGVLSVVCALVLPGRLVGLSGILYGLMGPVHAWNGFAARKAYARLASGSNPRTR
jgi:uncharacterized membrane protein